MSMATLRATLLNLGIIAGLAVAGWFLGAEALAHRAQPPQQVIVTSNVETGPAAGPALVVPRSGLSPFGHHGGLVGRQLLVGRVIEVDSEGFTAVTALGVVTFSFQDSSFLLRLQSAGPDAIEPGSAVALLVVPATANEAPAARSAIVLPADSRPQITANIAIQGMAPEGVDAEQEAQPGNDEDGEASGGDQPTS